MAIVFGKGLGVRVRVVGLGKKAQWDTSFRSGDHMIHGKTSQKKGS